MARHGTGEGATREDGRVAWMCRWHGGQVVVWAWAIEEARLEARQQAGANAAVSARLATNAEQAEAAQEGSAA